MLIFHCLLLVVLGVMGSYDANGERLAARRRMEILHQLDALGTPAHQLQPENIARCFNDTLRSVLHKVDQHQQERQHHRGEFVCPGGRPEAAAAHLRQEVGPQMQQLVSPWVCTSTIQAYTLLSDKLSDDDDRRPRLWAMARVHRLSVAEADINRVLCSPEATVLLAHLTEGIVGFVMADRHLPVRLDRLVLPFNPKEVFAASSAQRLEQLCAHHQELITRTLAFSDLMASGVIVGRSESSGTMTEHHFVKFVHGLLWETVLRYALMPLMAETLPWELCCLSESSSSRGVRQSLEAELLAQQEKATFTWVAPWVVAPGSTVRDIYGRPPVDPTALHDGTTHPYNPESKTEERKEYKSEVGGGYP